MIVVCQTLEAKSKHTRSQEGKGQPSGNHAIDTEKPDLRQGNDEHAPDPWSLFLLGMKSPLTKEKYKGRLAMFFDFLGLNGSISEKSMSFVRMSADKSWLFSVLVKFVQLQIERVDRKEISPGTLRNYIKAIRLFCEQNEIEIGWKRITRGLPKARRFADDRAPRIEEIRKIAEYPDRRIKAIIYTMCSSGMRLESWNYLRWGDIKAIERDGHLVAAKITIYAGDPEQYFSFITPEAYETIADWIGFREQAGEVITKDSWVMRDKWDLRKSGGCIERSSPSRPRKLKASGVKRLVEDALRIQGVRSKLPRDMKRHEFQANHGFRKWFKTRCEQAGLKSLVVEILLNHSTGITDSYYRPTEEELLAEYRKAVDALTINDQNRLRKQVQNLSEKLGDTAHITSRLEERERQVEALMKKQEHLEIVLQKLIDGGQLQETVRRSDFLSQ